MTRIVDERGIVAEMLAGTPASGPACELVDDVLRAIACGVIALRAWRRAPLDEDLVQLARVQGVAVSEGDCEQLRREGAMRGAR